MTVLLTFTCGKSDDHLMTALLDTLTPAFDPLGGILLPRQGPATGFRDPSFGTLAIQRSYRFRTRAGADHALRSPGYLKTDGLRGRFQRLDVALAVEE